MTGYRHLQGEPRRGPDLMARMNLRALRGAPLLHADELGALLRGEAWLGPGAPPVAWPSGLEAPRQSPIQTLRDATQLHRTLRGLSRRALLRTRTQRRLLSGARALSDAYVPGPEATRRHPCALPPDTWGVAAQVHLRAEMSRRLIQAAGPQARPGHPAIGWLRQWTQLRRKPEQGSAYLSPAQNLLLAMGNRAFAPGQLPYDLAPLEELQTQPAPLSRVQASWRATMQAMWQADLRDLPTLHTLAGRRAVQEGDHLGALLSGWTLPPSPSISRLRHLKLPPLTSSESGRHLQVLACLLCLSPETQERLIRREAEHYGPQVLESLLQVLIGELPQLSGPWGGRARTLGTSIRRILQDHEERYDD